MKYLLFIVLLASSVSGATHYVSKAGSDSNVGDGPGAGSAFLTIGKVVDNLAGGDTAYIGAGIWREHIDSIPPGTYGDRTAYIDSGWNASPGTRSAWIYGSDQLSGWTWVSGEIYKCYTTETIGVSNQIFQGDSLILREEFYANLDSAGEWYWNGSDSIYLWAEGGGDPDAADSTIELILRTWVDVANTYYSEAKPAIYGSNYVSLYGLGFKNCALYGISIWGTEEESGSECDSVFIDHCYLAHCTGSAFLNPSLVYSGHTDSSGHYNRIRGCTLITAYDIYNGESYRPWSTGSTGGSSTALYDQSYMTIDSNYVGGYYGNSGILIKGSYCLPHDSGNVIAFNTIDVEWSNNANQVAMRLHGSSVNVSVYGNILMNGYLGIQVAWSPSEEGGVSCDTAIGRGDFYNNTIYNCDVAFKHDNGEENYWETRLHQHYDTVKYNAVYSSGNSGIDYGDIVSDGGMFCDSNMYYCGGSFIIDHHYAAYVDSTIDSAAWVDVIGCDSNSTWDVDPAFDSVTAVDPRVGFARSGASGEMNFVIGTDTFTVYGAVQPSSGSSGEAGLSGDAMLGGNAVLE